MNQVFITWASARTNAEMTQVEVAKTMKVSVNTIINWEKYITEPTISQARKLCDLYKIPLDMIDTNGSKQPFFCESNQI